VWVPPVARDLFKQARENAIIFIDEIDAIGGSLSRARAKLQR
jgi:ATP-dependent Zn protease